MELMSFKWLDNNKDAMIWFLKGYLHSVLEFWYLWESSIHLNSFLVCDIIEHAYDPDILIFIAFGDVTKGN